MKTASTALFLLLVAMLLHPGAIALQCFQTTQHGDVLGACMELEGDPGGVADVCCTIQVQSFGFAGSHTAGLRPLRHASVISVMLAELPL